VSTNNLKGGIMFDSIEIRKVKNGVIVTLRNLDDEDDEYVYDTDRKAIKFVKELLDRKKESGVE
jgi:hypothetical protein